MSTEWNYYCPRCGIESDIDLNHGDRKLSKLIRDIAPVLEPLRVIMECEFLEVDLSFPIAPYHAIRFILEHWDHGLMLENEYGERIPLVE